MMLLTRLLLKVYTKGHQLVTGKEDGASLSEYGLLIAIVSLALIGAITACSGAIKSVFIDAKTEMSAVSGG